MDSSKIGFKFYKVGGYVRDKLLGVQSKDIDKSVVLTGLEEDLEQVDINVAFDLLCDYLEKNNFTIFLKTPACYTVRAKDKKNLVCDFVLARKELGYEPNTRKPIVKPGSLTDDLLRRDFTVNALAEDDDTGELIDICNGLEDLKNGVLRTPLDVKVTMLDDPLRIIRGLRFSITKGFQLDREFWSVINNNDVWDKFSSVVSIERVRDELEKMFKYDTIATLSILEHVRQINQYAYDVILKNISLKPTITTTQIVGKK